MVDTAVGSLEILQNNIPDGNVILTIRPEAIEIGANGHNNLPAQVRAYSYRGLVAYCQAGVDGLELQVAAPPYRTYQAGEEVMLHLPRERICLFEPKQGDFRGFDEHDQILVGQDLR
jgi:ABC-type sugar transport system ATPase subunit